MKKTKKNKTGKILAGTAAVAVAGAAAYALLGPDGKKNRAKVTKVAKDVKKKIANNKGVKKAEKMIDEAVKEIKSDSKKTLKKMVGLKDKAVKKAKTAVKKQVSKTAKKVASKKTK